MTNAHGADVSKYQSPTEWPGDIDFLIARASIGTTKDPVYDAHIARAKTLGIVTGAYHFNWDIGTHGGTAGPREQARFFVRAAGDVDLLFLDVEGEMAFEEAEAKAFIDEVHKLGRKVGLYMSAGQYRFDYGQDYDWIAYWSTLRPDSRWEFWQYTSRGRSTDGDRLDLDRFNGDKAALLKFVGRAVKPEPHVKLRHGAKAIKRRVFHVSVPRANVRREPKMGDNIAHVKKRGAAFVAHQVVDAGPGDPPGKWFGNLSGRGWMHSTILGD